MKLLMLTATTNNWSNCTVWKKAAELSEKTWQADFPLRQRTIAHVNNGPKLLGDTQLGSATPSRLFTRFGTFWLSSVFVDGPRARWAALRFLHPKMTSWMVCLERWGIFLAWYTQIARKMGKMQLGYLRGQVFWINLFLLPRKKKCVFLT